MKDLRKLTKTELIDILVEEFGYEKSDLKSLVNIELKEMIMKEQQFEKKVENENNGLSVIDDDRICLIANATNSRVTYDSDISHKTYVFLNHGDLQNMKFEELADIKRKNPRFLDWLYVIDQDIREQLEQSPNMYIEPRQLERLFSLNANEMLIEINKYNGAAYEVIAYTARQKCKNNQISDLEKIRALSNKFSWNMEEFFIN